MKNNFLSLIHQTAADKKRLQQESQKTEDLFVQDQQLLGKQFQTKLKSLKLINAEEIIDQVQLNQNDLISIKTMKVNEIQYKRLKLEYFPTPTAPQLSNKNITEILNDQDSKLETFVQPLYLEISDKGIQVLQGKVDESSDTKVSFVDFVDVNPRIALRQLRQEKKLQLSQEQYQSQDYQLQKIPALAPDQFIISYNEQEKAFILERIVKMPVIGHKLQIPNVTGLQRVQLEQQHIADHKAYVYYISESLSEEDHQEIIKNLYKPKIQPQQNRRKPIETYHGLQKLPTKKINFRQENNLNKSYQEPPNTLDQNDQLIPHQRVENLRFRDSTHSQLNGSVDQGYNPVYKTSKRTWEDFSHNITNQRRNLKLDIPKEVIQSKFKAREFNKFIIRKDQSVQIGRINKASHINIVTTGGIKNDYDIVGEHLYPKIKENEIFRSSPTNDFEGIQQKHKSYQQFLQSSENKAALTSDQLDSLHQNKHLWESVLSWEEVKLLRQDDNKYSHILQLLKLKFNQEQKSDYLKQLKVEFNYASRRDEMGGVLTTADKEIFNDRIEKLMKRDLKRKERRRKRRRVKVITSVKENTQSKIIFKEVFVNHLKN